MLNTLLNLFGEHCLDVLRDQLAVDSVPICYREEMGTSIFTQVRQYQERVLVGLVWILW